MRTSTEMEMPNITASSYPSAAYSYTAGTVQNQSGGTAISLDEATQSYLLRAQGWQAARDSITEEDIEEFMPSTNTRRIVRVYIADKDEDVPLEKSILFKGEEKLTDLTDQELYFEIPIKALLDKHNESRGQIRNKKATEKAGKDVFLDPLRIRDLTMTVVTIATF